MPPPVGETRDEDLLLVTLASRPASLTVMKWIGLVALVVAVGSVVYAFYAQMKMAEYGWIAKAHADRAEQAAERSNMLAEQIRDQRD